jgi:predicted Zn-dependent protease with MMP-like domain
VTPAARVRFDRLLEEVLAELPPAVHALIDRVPLHVEDYPSREVMEEMGIEHADELCGLYTGRPITEKSIDEPHALPDFVTIYRQGIVAAARDDDGRLRRGRLRDEIRTTVLHELAHHHGIDEDELRELGYD